uniref:Deubiquitinating protein VCIP135-like n=1 Tax=Phallusia mammillata TaxID=59560 RepID=A0A6F9DX53_9ASCI|nr:deubiquitinating protein VCIP135-like [Phallusia mammillata]
MVFFMKIEELVNTASRQTTFSPHYGMMCASKQFHSIPTFKLSSKLDRESFQAVIMKLSDRVAFELFSGIVNWTRVIAAAHPLSMPVDGFCLCHAISVYMCGAPDVKRQFEIPLQKSLQNNSQTTSDMCKRYVKEQRRKKLRGSSTIDTDAEWKKIVSVLSSPLKNRDTDRTTIFDHFHVFVMANICRRAIIVVTNGSTGSRKNYPSSVFLPLLLQPEEVIKCPIYLAFGMDHYVPLVFDKGPNTDEDILIPIMDPSFIQFEIPYLFDNENSLEYLNKYLFISSVGFTTAYDIQEVLAVRIPSKLLAKSLWKSGTNPSTIIHECYSPLREGGAIELCATLWKHVLEMPKLLNQQETSIESPSLTYQPYGDEEDNFEDANHFQTNTNHEVIPLELSTSAIQANSLESLNQQNHGIDRQDSSPVRLIQNLDISNTPSGPEESSIVQSSMDNVPDASHNLSSNFASAEADLSPNNHSATKIEDTTLPNTAGSSQATNPESNRENLIELARVVQQSNAQPQKYPGRVMMTTDDESTYAKSAPSGVDMEVPNIPKTSSSQHQSSAGAYSTDDVEISGGDNIESFASAVSSPNPRASIEPDNAPRTSSPFPENRNSRSFNESLSRIVGLEQLNEREAKIHEPKQIHRPINFQLKVDVCNMRSRRPDIVTVEFNNGTCELILTSPPHIVHNYKRVLNDLIHLALEVRSQDFISLNVTLPSYVSVREGNGGNISDLAMNTMMDSEEMEENAQVSPFSDPRKCRTAGCLNKGSPRYNNFCERCYSGLPQCAQRSNVLSRSNPKGAYSSGSAIKAGKCKTRNCDNAGEQRYRGYCFECYNRSGS